MIAGTVVEKPDLRQIFKGFILVNFFGIQVAMIVDDGLLLCVIVKQDSGHLIFKDKILI